MAATAAIHQIDGDPKYLSMRLAAIATFQGTGVMVTTATGFLANAADTAAHTAGGIVEPAGQGDEDLDNSGGGAGDLSVRVRTTGLALFKFTAPTQALVGQKVAWLDNDTVELLATATNDVVAGVVRDFDAALGTVEIELIGLGRV